MPVPKDQRANHRRRDSRGGRPTRFDKGQYKRRKEVERRINRLKSFRVVAIRYDKRAYVFHGTVAFPRNPTVAPHVIRRRRLSRCRDLPLSGCTARAAPPCAA